MGISTNVAENGFDLTVLVTPPFKGLYSQNTPTSIPEGYQPDILNMDVPAGIPETMTGSTLFATGMTISGTPTFFGVWYNTSGTPTYVGANTTGEVYYWTGSAWTYLRRGLSTSTTWWSATRISDFLAMSNKNDGIWKYDGTRLLPIGAKHIADMETTETWAGSGAADTTNVKQGTQGRKLTSTGSVVTSTYTPGTALDLVNGVGPTARDYTTSDTIHFWLYLDTAANLDTANSYIRFGNTGDTVYYQETAASWGTLVNGWNEVSMAKSIFNTTGSPNWNSIAKVTLAVDATGATTVNATFDDLYMRYATNMPACQVVLNFKNALIGLNDTAGTSNVNYARVSGPDDYDALATFPVSEGDGDAIVGGRVFYDQVVVCKNNSTHSAYATFSGTSYPAYRWAQTPITYAHGCASHRSIVEAEGQLFWWTPRDVVRYDGSTVMKVSSPIDPTIAGQEPTRLWAIVGARLRAENQLWWAYTLSGGSTNTRVLRYDYVQDAWLPSTGQTLPLLANVLSGGQDILLSVTSTGRVLQQGSGTTFDGSNISSSIDFPWMSANPERMVRWHELLFQYANGTGQVTVNYRTADHPREMAGASYSAAGTVTLSTSGNMGRVFIGARSRWLQLQFINVSGAVWQLLPAVKITGVLLPQRY